MTHSRKEKYADCSKKFFNRQIAEISVKLLTDKEKYAIIYPKTNENIC